MSAATTSQAEKHERREYLVTAFSKKPAGKNEPSSDILWSEVWDPESPLAVGYPFRWVLQKSGENVRIRDLGTDPSRVITHPFKEIPLEELGRRGAFELVTGDSNRPCWVLIQPVHELRELEMEVSAGGWTPEIIRPVSVSDVPAQRFLKKTSIAVTVGMLIAWLALFLMPKKPVDKDELIPEEFAKVLLSPALKQASSSAKASSNSGGGANVVQAFKTEAVQKNTKSLLSSKSAKALLSGSTLLNTSAASAQARRVFDGKSSLATKGIPTTQNLDVGSRQVGMIGGKGGGAPGTGYGVGGGAGVEGQGSGVVSVQSDNVGVSEGLTKNEVGKVIREHMTEVRYCYDSALLRHPALEGKLVVSFVVKASGSVSTTKIKEATNDTQLDQCIMARLAKWKFPKPRGGVDVEISYPFIFKVLGN